MEPRKPCPFCGYDDSELSGDDKWLYNVFCCRCNCHGPDGRTGKEAIDAWDRRREANDCPLCGGSGYVVEAVQGEEGPYRRVDCPECG